MPGENLDTAEEVKSCQDIMFNGYMATDRFMIMKNEELVSIAKSLKRIVELLEEKKSREGRK